MKHVLTLTKKTFVNKNMKQLTPTLNLWLTKYKI
jgi:hypothetical protein